MNNIQELLDQYSGLDFSAFSDPSSGGPATSGGLGGTTPVSLEQWISQMTEQGHSRGTTGQDLGDGLGNVRSTNNFRMPDGNWAKPQLDASGNVVGVTYENIGLGERLRDGVEDLAPLAAVVAGGAYAGAGAGSAGAGSGLGALGAPLTMPPGYVAPAAAGAGGAGVVGAGTVLAPGAAGVPQIAAGGGLLGSLSNAVGGGANLGTLLGGLSGVAGSLSEPSTIDSTTTSSIDPASRALIDQYAADARGQVGNGPNALTQQAGDLVSQLAGDNSTIDTAIAANAGRIADGGRNSYAGANPYLDEMLRRGTEDISRSFERSAEGVDSTSARTGSFGGSAWQQRRTDNDRQLGDAVSGYVNDARFADHRLQAGLEESRLGRQDSAISRAPALNTARFTGADALSRAGQNQFNQQQTLWNNYATSIPSVISASDRTQSTRGTNTGRSNPLSAGLGGAMLGQRIYDNWGR